MESQMEKKIESKVKAETEQELEQELNAGNKADKADKADKLEIEKQKPSIKTEAIKSKSKEKDAKTKKLLVPAEEYKRAAVVVGTKVITTGYMDQYVYKRRADGLAIIDVEKTDAKVQATINFLNQFEAKDILVFCKREAGWKAAEKFQEATGTKVFFRRYPAGIITNASLPDFFAPKVLLVVDPWIDKNALNDAVRIGIPVISLCDTNNVTNNIDLVIPCNNKTRTSIGLIFYLIAKGYAKKKGLPFKAKLEDFTGVIEGESEEKGK